VSNRDRRGASMRRFWDDRAREDPAFFVDDRLAYGDPDLDRLWEEGAVALANFADLLSIEIGPADTVLEIGCGVGRMTRAIAARSQRVVALDVSAEMIAVAKRLNPQLENVSWLEGDGTSLAGVGDGEVDACVSHVVFQHIPDPQITLGYVREIGRVLRGGGWAAIQVSNDPMVHLQRELSGFSKLRRLAGEAARRTPRGRTSPFWLGSAIDLDELGRAAEEGHLEVERVVGRGTQFCLVLLRAH
jgi:SAM-dependent methyltransferase